MTFRPGQFTVLVPLALLWGCSGPSSLDKAESAYRAGDYDSARQIMAWAQNVSAMLAIAKRLSVLPENRPPTGSPDSAHARISPAMSRGASSPCLSSWAVTFAPRIAAPATSAGNRPRTRGPRRWRRCWAR